MNDSLTFSHTLNTWLWEAWPGGGWHPVSAAVARNLAAVGARILDAI